MTSITVYSVPGPSTSKGVLSKDIPGGWEYVIQNLYFLSELNPGFKFEIILGHTEDFGPIPHLPKIQDSEIRIFSFPPKKFNSSDPMDPASQHGYLLNEILKSHNLKTDYFLILDPDCYVIMWQGLAKLIYEMKFRGLSSIGVSYPTTLPKVYYWDLPVAYLQMFDSRLIRPTELDFTPRHSSLLAGMGIDDKSRSFRKIIISILTKTLVRSKVPVREIIFRLANSRFILFQFFFYFYTNWLYKNTKLFQDTGWKNREVLARNSYFVLPHVIKPRKVNLRFNESEYLNLNLDLQMSNVNPTWHALMHGIFEGRGLGNQRALWKFLAGRLSSRTKSKDYFPASSLTMIEQHLFRQPEYKNFRYAYLYALKGELFCVHLGHGGKNGDGQDSIRLSKLRSLVLAKFERPTK